MSTSKQNKSEHEKGCKELILTFFTQRAVTKYHNNSEENAKNTESEQSQKKSTVWLKITLVQYKLLADEAKLVCIHAFNVRERTHAVSNSTVKL